MYKISKETNIGFLINFILSVWAAITGKVSFILPLTVPVVYGIMYLTISIFIWDKRRQVTVTVSGVYFNKGDLINMGQLNKKALVLMVDKKNTFSELTVFPIRISKHRFINRARMWYINISCYLRGVYRKQSQSIKSK